MQSNVSTHRVAFLDNLRSLIVLCVVALHAACAYSLIIPWWPVQEFPKEVPYTLVILILDLFCMPTLFFLAGFFAPPSLSRHGTAGFIRGKWRRLGVPFFLLAVFYVPIMAYIGYVARTPAPKPFFDFWLYQLSTAWKPEFFLLDSMEKALPRANDFSQWHLWFITLLLAFFLIYALAASLRRPSRNREQRAPATGRRIIATMLCFGAVSTALTASANMAIPGWSWASVGGYLMFQPTRLGLYFSMFVMGIAASKGGWFRTATFPGPTWAWASATLILNILFFVFSQKFIEITGSAPLHLALAIGFLRSFVPLAWLGFLLKMVQNRWNTSGPFSTLLRKNSYDIYLLHLPVVVGLQLLATCAPVAFSIKCLLEFLLASLICLLLSDKLVRPHPAISVGVLMAVFASACLFL